MERRNRALGIGLVVLGAVLLLGRWLDLGAFGWPLFVLLPGLLLLGAAFLGGRDAAALAVPGSIVTTIGLILFVQNATDTFESWAYAWGLIVASVGVGTFLRGALEHDEIEQRRGLERATVGLAMFAAFGAVFELFVFGGGGWLIRILLPLALIGAGAWLLFGRRDRRPEGR